jgi:hypothetical protein
MTSVRPAREPGPDEADALAWTTPAELGASQDEQRPYPEMVQPIVFHQ